MTMATVVGRAPNPGRHRVRVGHGLRRRRLPLLRGRGALKLDAVAPAKVDRGRTTSGVRGGPSEARTRMPFAGPRGFKPAAYAIPPRGQCYFRAVLRKGCHLGGLRYPAFTPAWEHGEGTGHASRAHGRVAVNAARRRRRATQDASSRWKSTSAAASFGAGYSRGRSRTSQRPSRWATGARTAWSSGSSSGPSTP